MGKILTVKARFNIGEIQRYVDQQIREYINRVIEVYKKAGVAMVEDARSRTKDLGAYDGGSFGNITWDLRSSIGCGIFRNGETLFSYYPILNTGADGAKTGAELAYDVYANGLSSVYAPNDIVLIVTAGKEYARAVESKGYNVIDATANIAEEILERYILLAAA